MRKIKKFLEYLQLWLVVYIYTKRLYKSLKLELDIKVW